MASKYPDRDEAFVAAQRGILESIAFGRPLHQMLQTIVELIEARSDGMLCSILLIEADRIRHVAAPNLPKEYIAAIEGEKIGPNAGSCGTAAFTGQPVVVEDIASAPSWQNYRHLALPHGLLACWSTPILTPDRQVLGTFAMYYRERRGPSVKEKAWVEVATYLAYVAILSDRARLNEIERHRMQAQLRQGEHLRSVILDNIDDAIVYLQVEGEGRYRLLSVNRAFGRMFPQLSERIVGRMIHEFLPEGIREQTLEGAASAIATGEAKRWEVATQTGPKRAEVTLVPILDQRGRCTNLVGTLHDVSARIDAENQRAQMQMKLHQAQRMQALGTLAGGIAHDFNNILAAIGGNAELLLAEVAMDSNAHRYAAEIMRASTRATDLVRQILSFSRSSSPTYEVFDPRPVALEAINLLRSTLPKHIHIETHFAQDTPGLRADASQFHQVLINLVSNAARAYAGEGLIIVRLDRAMDTEAEHTEGARLDPGTYIRLRVEDRGSGMDAATLKRAFDPFFTTRPPGEGTGLGLSVVHSIVESHRGFIGIESAPGKGTVVTVYLPAAEFEANKVVAAPAELRGHDEKVMYVDDEDSLVQLVELHLRRLGYRTRGFNDPEVALREFSRAPQEFDIVITDLAMPRMSGRQLAAKIREISPDVPIIMTSGYIRDEDREAARQLNIAQLVYKSNTVRQLADALATEIGRLAIRRP